MRYHLWRQSFFGRVFDNVFGSNALVLPVTGLLVVCQFVLWMTALPPMGAGTSRDHGLRAIGQAPRQLADLQLPQHATPTGSPASLHHRYYDPGLASVAEYLNAESRYFVAMALEECYAVSHAGLARLHEDFQRRLLPGVDVGRHASARLVSDHETFTRERAFADSVRACLGFEGASISPGRILALLQSAAREGDPRALARTLLFRDLAESKEGTFDLVTRLLSTTDPLVLRDVGLFLTRGESAVKFGDGRAPADAALVAAAWELVACDFGMDCGRDSKLLNNLCAYQGQCGAFSYEDWLERYSASADDLQEILRLRMLLRRGVMARDWGLLGLSALKGT